jgi:hypothetical protein
VAAANGLSLQRGGEIELENVLATDAAPSFCDFALPRPRVTMTADLRMIYNCNSNDSGLTLEVWLKDAG